MTHAQDVRRLYELRQRVWPVGAGSKRRSVPRARWCQGKRSALIDIARACRSGGLPQDGVRAQPLLFFGQQRVDELRLRCNSTGTHQFAQAGFRNADCDGALGGHAESPLYDDSLMASYGSGSGGHAGDASIPPPHAGAASVEGLARIADLDPEVPPFVAREQAAQLVPSDLEVVDEHHGPPSSPIESICPRSERVSSSRRPERGSRATSRRASQARMPSRLSPQGGSPSLAGRTKRSPAQAPS